MQNAPNTRPLLEIFVLGRFQVKINGVAIEEKLWGRRSAKSLIKLLALKPFHALHREQIMDLLWTEESPETALNNLNKAIYKARRALEPNLAKGSDSLFILTQKKQIILESPGMLSVDLDEFERLANYALQNNDLKSGQKAVELYRGDLLIEDIYEDWIYTRRESMRILFRKIATKTAELYGAKGEQTNAVEILKKLVTEDATDEYIHRLLMRLYAETGSKYQALKQFELCRAALQNLGIEPEPETIKLEQSIKRGEIIAAKNDSKSAPPIVSTPHTTPLTFQNGIIRSAKFLPDGETIVFGATWENGVSELYTMSLKTNETHRLGIEEAEIFSVSAAGEMAIAINPRIYNGINTISTLATVSSAQKSPLKLLEEVQCAVYSPTDEQLAVVRDRDGKNCLEFPIGKVIYETGGWISHPQFSVDGAKIAFIEHPIPMDDEGFIVALDLKDNGKKILTDNFITVQGLAWTKDEIRFTASRKGTSRMIYAVDLNGVEREVYRGIGNLKLHDISTNGDVLITDDKIQSVTLARHAGEDFERDLSWHQHTFPRDISADGQTLLIEESGVSGRDHYSAYIRRIDGSGTKLIANASPLALSPDGKRVLLRIPNPHNHLALTDIETGETIPLETDPANELIYQEYACFFPDGKKILFAANKLDSGTRIYIQNLDGGIPVCFTPDEEVSMYSNHSISPDGKFVVLKNSANKLSLYCFADGTSAPFENLEEDFDFSSWTDDGENFLMRRIGEVPAVIYKYNPANGTKEKWLEIMPKDSNAANFIRTFRATPDGKTYAYCYYRESSDLYLLEDFQ